jgi:hypothetical protein
MATIISIRGKMNLTTEKQVDKLATARGGRFDGEGDKGVFYAFDSETKAKEFVADLRQTSVRGVVVED